MEQEHQVTRLRTVLGVIDWPATPVGPVEAWDPLLRATAAVALDTRFPAVLFWGPRLAMVYNADFAALIGGKHPAAAGAPAVDVVPELWDELGPLLERVRAGHGPTWIENARLLIERHGFREEVFVTASYSPMFDARGEVAGVLGIATETTEQVLDRRRIDLVTRLSSELSDIETDGELADLAALVLRAAHRDVAAVALRIPRSGTTLDDPRIPALDPAGAPDDLAVEDTPAGRVARLRIGSDGRSARPAVLSLLLTDALPFDEAYEEFVRLVGATITQALDRVGLRQAARRVAAGDRAMSESLQRSLLTPPAQTEAVQVAVRYRPAAELAQVGGDWYDACVLPDGVLAVVVGDVSGHDQVAAAGMAQVRNLLRGIALTQQGTPAAALAGLDRAVRQLRLRSLATAVMAQVGRRSGPDGAVLTVRWANAGHPPPALLRADGSACLLAGTPELMIGVDSGTPRTVHTVDLAPGDHLVLYTDGLVERRDRDLDDGLARLVEQLAGWTDPDPEALCEHLLGHVGEVADDDVVLAVVHARTPA